MVVKSCCSLNSALEHCVLLRQKLMLMFSTFSFSHYLEYFNGLRKKIEERHLLKAATASISNAFCSIMLLVRALLVIWSSMACAEVSIMQVSISSITTPLPVHPRDLHQKFAPTLGLHPSFCPGGQGFVGIASEGRVFVYKRFLPFLEFSL